MRQLGERFSTARTFVAGLVVAAALAAAPAAIRAQEGTTASRLGGAALGLYSGSLLGLAGSTVAGDFNVWSKDNSALKLFRRKYPESPPWTGEPTRGAFPPDHLFFKRATDGEVQLVPGSFRRIEERYYSDHHGLAVQVVSAR